MAARHKGSQLLTVVSKDKVAEEGNDIAMSTPHANDTNNAQEGALESTSLASQHEPAARLAVGNTSGELSKDKNINEDKLIPTPHCYNMVEHSPAAIERARLNNQIRRIQQDGESPEEHTLDATENGLLSSYISHGLAYTIGSALSRLPPPTQEICLQAFLVPNKAGLTAGARAWSKHAHRSGNTTETPSGTADDTSASNDALKRSLRWWGTPSGPVARINERAVELFWKVWRGATWRNLHWLPHQVLVYEIRVSEGYGMRWAQDLGRNAESVQIPEAISQNVPSLDAVEASVAPSSDSDVRNDTAQEDGDYNMKTPVVRGPDVPWVFRGFVEPMMDNGHEVGWRH